MTETLSAQVRAAAERLAAAGIPDAARDARALAAHAAGIAPDRVSLEGAAPVAPAFISRFAELVAGRIARRPVSHLTGQRAFWGRSFAVTPDVLDPRPETETLVALALDRGPATRLLDLGTGSGCIALTLLAEWPDARAVAVDISAAALAVARRNADALGLARRVEFRQTSWWLGIGDVFDLIVSNPPYIAQDEMAGLQPEVRDWEPHLALTPGGDGLDAYRAIAAELDAHLAPGGRALFEIGATQGPAVTSLLRDAGLSRLRVHRDLSGHERVVEVEKA